MKSNREPNQIAGPRKFFALRWRNWATWFDITVVVGSAIFAVLQVTSPTAGLPAQSQGQNLALTVLFVPYSQRG